MDGAPTPNLLAFIHVPKTAGTSFLRGLEARCETVYRDYHADGPTSPLVREALYEPPVEPLRVARAALLRDLVADAAARPSEPAFLCGHFCYWHYPFAELDVPVITFLRDPLERVLSHYTHARRARGERRPLARFVAEDRRNENAQSKMLAGIGLDEVAFVGLTERFEESIELFNRQTGLDVPALARNRSDGPGWRRLRRLGRPAARPAEAAGLDPQTRELILSRNSDDIELYRAARGLVDSRLEKAAIAHRDI